LLKGFIINNYRIDTFLIWGHGLKHLFDIIDILKKDYEILFVQRVKVKNIKKFVKKVYSFDYAPYWHLKDKTNYLLTTPKEVCFIFIKNVDSDEDYLDVGEFRHKESLKIKRTKELIRDKFNPYENGIRTHHHVIHATDNEAQSDYLLSYIGYDGIEYINQKNIFNIPRYLTYQNYSFIKINPTELYASILEGESWDKYKVTVKALIETPHYLGLKKDMKIYNNYIQKFLGGALKEFYDVEKFKKLSNNFKYLEKPYNSNYIIVTKKDDKFIILDGIHRSCNLIDKEEIIVCQVN